MQNGTPPTLPSRNEAWGFFGTIRHHAEPSEAWALAMEAIANTTGRSGDAIREFLDSRYGRHFADQVASAIVGRLKLPNGVESAVQRWMGWKINARIEDELGIPQGLPYLTGLVCMQEALLQAKAD